MKNALRIHARLTLTALAGFIAMACGQSPSAKSVTATMHFISAEGIGAEAGTITIAETAEGLVVTPNLHGFRPGFHAFHAHEVGSCDPAIGESGKMEAGRAAGPHYNGVPGQTAPPMTHEGMNMDGMSMPAGRMPMRGDMPQLTAAADGTITAPIIKTGLSLDEIRGRAVVMHPYGEEGKDPERPTDGSASVRIACAILPK